MGFLKSLLGRFITEPALKQLAARLSTWLHSLVDIAVAYGLMLAINYMNGTDNDVIMQEAGPVGFAGWVSVLFAIAGLLTRILPWIVSTPPKAPLILALLLIPSLATAGTITGPSAVAIPHFTSDLPKTSTGVWVVIPRPAGEKLNDDGSFDFWGPAGTYAVILIEVTKNGEQVRTEQLVTLDSSVVPPTPGPPTPTPPDIPDGVHGFTKWAYATTAAYPAADRAKGHAVAAFLKNVANQLASGQSELQITLAGKTVKYPATATGLQQATKDWLTEAGGSWAMFPAALGTKLKSTAEFKKTNADYTATWIAAADGITKSADIK